ncbi:MAG: hypothetical protein HY784_18610 [Chloroflexi bacterium]|nr:hypothetical protein [Chloroflexota bacterium]
MNPALDKLLKFFKLEAERGYDNKAVLGGLDKMLESWSREAETAHLDPAIVEVVSTRLTSYPDLSPKSREETLRGIWRRVQSMDREGAGGDAEASPPAAAPVTPAPRPGREGVPAPPPPAAAP